MKSKKVLFVATVVKGHINVFHLPYLKLFKDNGWVTAVAATNDFEVISDCQIPYCDKYYDIKLERNPVRLSNIRAYYQLKKIIDDGNFDIVHCHTPVGAMIARLAARKARKKGTRVIYTAHGFHFYKGAPVVNWILYYPVEKFLSRFTDDLITINLEDYSYAKKFHAKKVHYVRGVGIDKVIFCNKENTRKDICKEFNLAKDTFILATVGELSKRKNQIAVLKALTLLKGSNISLLICGRGALKQQLEEFCKQNGIESKVRFLGFRKDISRILHGCDAFIFPSLQEGLPVATMEAMGSGKPVIASNVRGNRDLVVDNKNGFLLDPNDIEGIAEKILYLKNHRDIASKMGEYSISTIEPYLLDSVSIEMEKIYFDK